MLSCQGTENAGCDFSGQKAGLERNGQGPDGTRVFGRCIASGKDDAQSAPAGSEVADGPYNVILDQVTNGVAVRAAVLFLLLGGKNS